MLKGLFDFIKSSPTAFHTVASVCRRLDEEGYTRIAEGSNTELASDGKYYIVRNGSSVIAFRLPKERRGFMIVASHSDSPSFRVKMNEEHFCGAYTSLNVERYGGMIMYSWLDRPLSVAGRVFVDNGREIEEKLVSLDRDLAVIPSVAIHFNRGVNDGYKFNPARDMLPLYAAGERASLMNAIAEQLGTSAESIISHDLFLFNRDEPRTVGADNELILAPRIDDLGCVFASLEAFLASEPAGSVPVLAVFDNEEVGSETKQGAASDFLYDVLTMIGGDSYREMLANGLMVSADNAHAIHPNHPELSDADNAPRIGGGVVIKFNASQRYATDGYSAAAFEKICRNAAARVQYYYNRADMPGGSTLGSISNTKVSIPTVDIGLPQLAMHAANETAGRDDIGGMIKALSKFYSSSLTKSNGTLTIN